MTGTGSFYTHACIPIDGSMHKKTDRKLILENKSFSFLAPLISASIRGSQALHQSRLSAHADPRAHAWSC